MKLFDVGKIGIYLTNYQANTERRRDGEVQILVLSCKIHPFDHKLAQAMDPVVRASLFRLTGNADPLPHVQGLAFTLPLERQDIHIFATPDTDRPSIRLEQVKVSGLKAKLEKGSHAFVASLRLSFGPVSARELEWVHAARTTQKWMSFAESAPDLAYLEVDSNSTELDDTDDDTRPKTKPLLDDPDPSDDTELATVGAKPERAQHRALSHANGKGKKK